MRKILIGAIALILLAVATVLVVGVLLPEQHVATVRAEFGASPTDVYRAIADFPNHPRWRAGVERMESGDERSGRPVWREIGADGVIPFEVTETDPPERMVTTIVSDGLPFGGRWVYRIRETPTGAELTITEEGEVYNPVFRFVATFVIGHHATATRFLQDLGAHLGEDVSIDRID